MSVLGFWGGYEFPFYSGPASPLWGLFEGQYSALGSSSILGFKIPTKIGREVWGKYADTTVQPLAGVTTPGFPDALKNWTIHVTIPDIDGAQLLASIKADMVRLPPNKYRVCLPWWWNTLTKGLIKPIGPNPKPGAGVWDYLK